MTGLDPPKCGSILLTPNQNIYWDELSGPQDALVKIISRRASSNRDFVSGWVNFEFLLTFETRTNDFDDLSI